MARGQALIPVVAAGASIPRVIHQIFFSNNSRDPPPLIQQNIERIGRLNAGWQHKLYDQPAMVEFIRANFGPEVLDYFHRINPKYGAARADLFRYLLMYRQGGIYLDVKSSHEKPFDEVLRPDDVYLLSRWRNAQGQRYEGWGMHRSLRDVGGQEFQQWHIIAAPGHPFLRSVIERVLANIDRYNPVVDDVGKGGVLRLSGPIAYTRAIAPILALHPHRLVDSESDLRLIYSIYGRSNEVVHSAIFSGVHYTKLNEPVIDLSGAGKWLWWVLGPLRRYLVEPLLHVLDGLSRRLYGRAIRRG